MSTPDPLIGTSISGKYRIEEVLDEGGFAVVYRAEHVDLGRPVAVKVLREGLGSTDELLARFEREARVLASLTHPHIVNLVDYGVSNALPYLVMELLPGRTLKDDITRGPLPAERAFSIAKQILRAVAFAHGANVLHRDLKPANIFLQVLPDTPDHVKILDFGFAKLITPEAAEKDQRRLTRTGQAFGTPSYVAPEQITEGAEVDARADVYAVGLILFEMLSGKKPFSGDAAEQVRKKLSAEAPLLSERATSLYVSPEVDRLVANALARSPEMRVASAEAFLQALETLPENAVRMRTEPPPPLDDRTPDAVPRVSGFPSALPASMPAPAPASARAAPIVPILLGVIALLATLLLVVGGFMATMVMRTDDDAESEHGLASSGLSQTAHAADGSGDAEDLILAVERHLERGDAIDDETVRGLRDRLGAEPTDGRPHVLIGHIYVARAWQTDALDHYERAALVDRGACDDPRMIANLVGMAVSTPRVSRRSIDLLDRVYGADALPAVDRALAARGDLSPHDRTALERLRGRIAGR